MNIVSIIVIAIIILVVAIFSKKKTNVFIAFGLVDVFLRIVDYIGDHTISEVNSIINKIFPDSIGAIITHYSTGVLKDILMWIYVFLMALFFYYVLRMLLKRL